MHASSDGLGLLPSRGKAFVWVSMEPAGARSPEIKLDIVLDDPHAFCRTKRPRLPARRGEPPHAQQHVPLLAHHWR
jgi:hypothetical protein